MPLQLSIENGPTEPELSSFHLTIDLGGPAGPSGAVVNLAAEPGSLLTFPSSVFIPPGDSSVIVTVMTGDAVGDQDFTITGSYVDAFATVDGTVLDQPTCFCRDTLILTPSGERPVQDLTAGDAVLTHSGAERRILWIGHGQVLATRGRRSAATPVIVRRHALAPDVPRRDLRVTKAHALLIDGVLIPVEFLVNHRSILWDDAAQEVALFHIALDTHDVLVADGAPAESFRDDGNGWLFRNGHACPPEAVQPPCLPVLTGGPAVDAAWRRLLDRAGPRPGLPTTADPGLHLLADGQRVAPAWQRGATVGFRLAASPAQLRILSRSAVPAELGIARDPRCLGVAIRRISVIQGRQIRMVEADDPALRDGFHPYECADHLRWTSGDAAVPAGLFNGLEGPVEVALTLAGQTLHIDEGASCQAA